MDRQPKILLWDIETSYALIRAWGLFEEVTSHKLIVEDWHIICSCYKWLGEKKVHALVKSLPKDDKELCAGMREVLPQADIVVHHNGDAFDYKKLNARLIKHDLLPIPELRTVDTLKQARKIAKFTSNRLDYLGKQLGVGGKIENPPNLWPEATDGDEKAIAKMVRYCKRDVDLLEKVYLKLRPHMRGHPNVNLDREIHDGCPNCGSQDLQCRGFRKTRAAQYQRYQCMVCGAWSSGKKALATVAVR